MRATHLYTSLADRRAFDHVLDQALLGDTALMRNDVRANNRWKGK